MKCSIFILICLISSNGFSQDKLPILISNDADYLLMFEPGFNDIPDGQIITLYNSDSLYVPIKQYILKEDSVFSLYRSFPGQRGINYYFNDQKKNEVIYDTLKFADLCQKFHFDPNALIFPVQVEYKLDTLEYLKKEIRTKNNYFPGPWDTIDLSYSAIFTYRFLYENVVLHMDTLKPEEGNILNYVDKYSADLYVDKKRNLYFLNVVMEVKEHEESKETYEIMTTLYLSQFRALEVINW